MLMLCVGGTHLLVLLLQLAEMFCDAVLPALTHVGILPSLHTCTGCTSMSQHSEHTRRILLRGEANQAPPADINHSNAGLTRCMSGHGQTSP